MIEKIVKEVDQKIIPILAQIDKTEQYLSQKVLAAFQKENVTESDFMATTGYGYNDVGRDKLERIFASMLGAEDGLVRSQFISGSHALCVTLFALLRPGDTLLSISGKPYDTLDEVIGITPNPSSLASFGIFYDQIDLIEDDFDIASIKEKLQQKKIKVIAIQRSKGYSTRKSLSISKVEAVIREIRKIDQDVIIMVDNCYCEFVSIKEPCEVGASIAVGSLIKNLGAGIAPNGAYVVGKKELVELVAERLTLPGEGREVGPSLGINKQFYQGLFFAPSVVASALKTAVFTSCLLETLGYQVEPNYQDSRVDIVQNIIFHNPKDLVTYCRGIQAFSPIDSNVAPLPAYMPGYSDDVIMASGSFTQGSSIELSCDGPMRSPYIAYQQGSLTYAYGRLAVINACQNLLTEKEE